MTKLTPERERRLLALVTREDDREKIARQLQVSLPTLARWARKLGVSLPDGRRRALVPAWVPNYLVRTFRQVARRSGEEEAAMHVRRLKQRP